MEDFVSADGSPVAAYLALAPDDAASHVARVCPPEGTVLELGSGPGRTTRPLVAHGFEVTAVDDSEEMLAHVTGAERVCADVIALDLGRRFDVVLLASFLLNRPDGDERIELLRTCHRHVAPSGVVLAQRHVPGWLLTAPAATGNDGLVELTYTPGRLDGRVRHASMTYRLGDRSWTQHYRAADVDDETLANEAAAAGLRLDPFESDDGTWVVFRPT